MRLEAVLRQVLPIGLQIVARVDRGQGPGDPSGLVGRGGVGQRAALDHPERRSGLQQGVLDACGVLPRSEDFQARVLLAGRADHGVVERADRHSGDLEPADVEEPDPAERPARRGLDDLQGGRPLDLVAEQQALARVDRGGVVPGHLDVVVTGLGVELDPVRRHRCPDQRVLVLVEAEEDGVADEPAARARRDELLGPVPAEAGEGVHADLGEQPLGVGAPEVDVAHVEGLVEQDRGLPPHALLVTPVRVLRARDRERVGAAGVGTQHPGRVATAAVDGLLEAEGAHGRGPFLRHGRGTGGAGNTRRAVAHLTVESTSAPAGGTATKRSDGMRKTKPPRPAETPSRPVRRRFRGPAPTASPGGSRAPSGLPSVPSHVTSTAPAHAAPGATSGLRGPPDDHRTTCRLTRCRAACRLTRRRAGRRGAVPPTAPRRHGGDRSAEGRAGADPGDGPGRHRRRHLLPQVRAGTHAGTLRGGGRRGTAGRPPPRRPHGGRPPGAARLRAARRGPGRHRPLRDRRRRGDPPSAATATPPSCSTICRPWSTRSPGSASAAIPRATRTSTTTACGRPCCASRTRPRTWSASCASTP